MKNLVTSAEHTEGLHINYNRASWDTIYAEIRRLAVKKGVIIASFFKKSVSPQQVAVYRYGKAIYKDKFHEMPQGLRKQVVTIMQQMEEAYSKLYELQATIK